MFNYSHIFRLLLQYAINIEKWSFDHCNGIYLKVHLFTFFYPYDFSLLFQVAYTYVWEHLYRHMHTYIACVCIRTT